MRRLNPIGDYALGAFALACSWYLFFKFQATPHPTLIAIAALIITIVHVLLRFPALLSSDKNNLAIFLALSILTLLPSTAGATRNSLTVVVGMNGVIALAAAASSGKGLIAEIFSSKWESVAATESRAFTIILFIATTVAYAVGNQFVFGGIPHVQDEIAQLFHARILATGRLVGDIPELREFFDFPNMIMRGGWYSQYPPGHVIMLAIGVIIHAPWIVNPILAATTNIVVYKIGIALDDEKTGRGAALLLAISPFFYFLGASYMNHITTALAIALFVLYFIRMEKSGKLLDGLVAGSAIGYAALTRPLTAFAMCLPFAAYSLWKTISEKKISSSRMSAALAALLMVALLFAYNRATNRSFEFGYTVLHGKFHDLGFGLRGLKGMTPEEHTLARGLLNMSDDVTALSKFLFEWPMPSLFFAIAALFCARGGVYKKLIAAAFASLAVAHVFFFFHRMILGPRFLSEAAPLICVLTAIGIRSTGDYIGKISEKAIGIKFVSVAIGISIMWSFAVNVPALYRAYSSGFWMVTPGLNDLVESNVPVGKKALVFIENDEAYGSGFAYNTPSLDGRIVYARNLGAKNGLLISKYPDRVYYFARMDLEKGLIGIREMLPGSF